MLYVQYLDVPAAGFSFCTKEKNTKVKNQTVKAKSQTFPSSQETMCDQQSMGACHCHWHVAKAAEMDMNRKHSEAM